MPNATIVHDRPWAAVWADHRGSLPGYSFMRDNGIKKLLRAPHIARGVLLDTLRFPGPYDIEFATRFSASGRASFITAAYELLSLGLPIMPYIGGIHEPTDEKWDHLFLEGKAAAEIERCLGRDLMELFEHPMVSVAIDGSGVNKWNRHMLVHYCAARGWRPVVEAHCESGTPVSRFRSLSLGGYVVGTRESVPHPLPTDYPLEKHYFAIINSHGQNVCKARREMGSEIVLQVGWMGEDGSLPEWFDTDTSAPPVEPPAPPVSEPAAAA